MALAPTLTSTQRGTPRPRLFHIQRLRAADLYALARVQRSCYGAGYLEGRRCFAHKLALFPRGALALRSEGRLVGYAIAHPWRLGRPLPLDDAAYRLPRVPTCLYLHDIALAPEARGLGLVAALVDALVAVAQAGGLRHYALTAVQGSEPYWRRWGFHRSSSLRYGGAAAAYMVRRGAPLWS